MDTRPPAPRIFLCGMMAAGKSTLGRRLAEVLGGGFVDLDARVVEAEGRSIAELFETGGEVLFRAAEQRALESLLRAPDPHRPTVVALGGGTWVQPENAERLRTAGTTVFLDAPLHILEERLLGAERVSRPLLAGGEVRAHLAALHAARAPLYAQAHVTLPVGDVSVEEATARLLPLLPPEVPLRVVEVPLGERAYPIWIGVGGADQAAQLVELRARALKPAIERLFIVSDDGVPAAHREAFVQTLQGLGWPCEVRCVEQGEGSKSAEVLAELWGWLIGARVGRRDAVVAFGGGVVGDLAGFAAATILRGVRLLQVPTTLLSMVDSSVGGKTGINHGGLKNLVGAFHQPVGVAVALGVLSTLPAEEVSSGLGEVVKYAVLEGEGLLAELERRAPSLRATPSAHLELVARCCAFKARVVAEDERESGPRALLNLGHSFGHAIEVLGRLPHGVAVALGMLIATRVAPALGGADPAASEALHGRLGALLGACGLPTDATPWLARREALLDAMRADKKSSVDRITLVLPHAPGDVRLQPVRFDQLDSALQNLARPPVCA